MAPISAEEELVGLTEKLGRERAKLRDTEIEFEEADVPRVPAKVYTPSPEEYNRHCATHLPYRNWCPICVRAKKRNPPHKHTSSDSKYKHIPNITMDYMYLNEKNDDVNHPILIMHDSMSEGVWAIFARKKGDNDYVVKRVVEIIKRLGYSKIVLKSDQEPAIRNLEGKAQSSIWADAEQLQENIKQECGCQVVVQHSPVGESAANGMAENTVQRVQGQIRALKLDLETNLKMKLNSTLAVWPWLIEYAAQTLLYWRASGDDGLTAIQRIRGRSTTSPRPRFGERVLYKIAKTVRLGKSEPKWQYGIFLGTIESSDEHMLGTELGVIKARAVTAVPEGQRFDAQAIQAMKGVPWRPSTKHPGSKIRTHIDEDKEGSDGDEEGDHEVQVEVYQDEDPQETLDDIKKEEEIIFSRSGESYGFYIKARDVAKYGATAGCPGCKYVKGEVTTQCGHSKECKTRMMQEMEKDKDDKHRVRRWYVAKGIDADKTQDAGVPGQGAHQDNKDQQKNEEMTDSGAASSSAGPSRRDEAMNSAEPASSSSGPGSGATEMEPNTKKAKTGKEDESMEKHAKKKKLACLNLAGFVRQHTKDHNSLKETCMLERPTFVILDESIAPHTRHYIKQQQHNDKRYFIEVMGGEIVHELADGHRHLESQRHDREDPS